METVHEYDSLKKSDYGGGESEAAAEGRGWMETECIYFSFILKVCCEEPCREKEVKDTKRRRDSSRSPGRWVGVLTIGSCHRK